MDLLIPNSWLKKYLKTNASEKQIASCLTLCGPSVEKIKKTNDNDYIYSIEVTTNRVDTASILGIAREAAAILPRFKISASLKPYDLSEKNYKFVKKVKYLDVTVDSKLCPRFTAVLIKDIVVKESPQAIKLLLEKVGVRPINNIVDVSNYIMHELGQPVHTFDYDKLSLASSAGKISPPKMILRESKKGETITTLDGKEFKLDGGDIVIEDGSGELIDLCGIMGGENSVIDNNTKNVLLFVQNYNQHYIRKTSMILGQRTEAAILFEKGLDSENVKPTILSAISMIEKLSGGKAEKEILDIYSVSYKTKIISTNKEELDKIIGVEIPKKNIIKYMTSLGFEVKQQGVTLLFNVPSWRGNDIEIKEDIAEEIARIYGYHNLPCKLMEGVIPAPRINPEFVFEKKIKNTLQAFGAVEVYNLSLVSKEMVNENALKLKNPLGSDTEYLRTSLMPSLQNDILDNPQEKGFIHFFEIANIYPKEILTLAGIVKNEKYRENKGLVETLLENLDIDYTTKLEDGKSYLANQKMIVISDNKTIGEYGNLENGYFFYEFDIQKTINSKKISRKYKEIAKYPPQIEDLTLIVPEKTYIGDVIAQITNHQPLITKAELTDIYENNYTFNIQYQSEDHTLTDKEVEAIRTKILSNLKSKFGIVTKE